MLEVFSPIPMTEGESLIAGINTKHVLHFLLGVGISTPLMGIALLVFPMLGFPKLASLVIGGAFGLFFAMVPVKNRPLAEYLWLSFRHALRPKVILYDRAWRIRQHRKDASAR